MFNGTSTPVSIASDTPGERVFVDGVAYQTPVQLDLDNYRPHVVHGPDWKSYEIRPVIARTAGLSVLLAIIPPLGLLAVVVDGATGSNFTLTPVEIDVSSGAVVENPDRAQVATDS